MGLTPSARCPPLPPGEPAFSCTSEYIRSVPLPCPSTSLRPASPPKSPGSQHLHRTPPQVSWQGPDQLQPAPGPACPQHPAPRSEPGPAPQFPRLRPTCHCLPSACTATVQSASGRAGWMPTLGPPRGGHPQPWLRQLLSPPPRPGLRSHRGPAEQVGVSSASPSTPVSPPCLSLPSASLEEHS